MDEELDDMTQDEETIEEETGTSAEVSHRIGEFRDLRDRLEEIQRLISEQGSRLDTIAKALATRVVETDSDANDETEELEEYADPRERDYTLD